MQRIGAISTLTDKFVQELKGFNTKGTRHKKKQLPPIDFLEKQAVKIGGGHNHRFGLYDTDQIQKTII